MPYLLGIDIGTTGTRALVIDETGAIAASATSEYPLSTPRPNWAEQDPEYWWLATVTTVREALGRSGIAGSEVVSIGLSGQMHGSVFLDDRADVVRPAILWCDQRTAAQCQWIHEAVGYDTVVSETLNPVLTGFTAPKIVWLRDNEPEAYARVRKVLLPKDYIRYRLTGEFATEVSDASGTSLLNVRERRWSSAMLDGAGIPQEWMPEVYESPEVSGDLSARAAEVLGLVPGTPIVGGGGDQAAGAIGNGIVETGVVSSTVGTSGVVFAYLDEPLMDPKLRTHTFCHAVPGKWHVMGVMLSAGGSLRWLRDAICQPEVEQAKQEGRDPYEVMAELAAAAPVGSEGLIFLPYLTGERTPYPDPNAKGVFFGLTVRHDKRHLIRSVMEGVAFGMRDSLEIIKAMGAPVTQIRASGGGARSRLWRQIHADVTGQAHVTINVDEGPAFGVALLAGVGAGVWESVAEACRATIGVTDSCEADLTVSAAYKGYYELYGRLYGRLEGSFDEVQALVEGAGA